MHVNFKKQNVTKSNGGITINVDNECKKHHICEKEYGWNPSTCICEIFSKYYE